MVTIAGIVAYLGLATAVRRRSLRLRGPSLRRIGGAAALLPYLLPIPYAVIALRRPVHRYRPALTAPASAAAPDARVWALR